LLPGDVARVDWPGVGAPLVVVPASAILRRSQLEQVAVVREGKAEIRLVRTAGPAGEGRVAVATGLSAGERVVVESKSPLRDGQPVEASR
jgi:multidrug efflux system membrane fusion protein